MTRTDLPERAGAPDALADALHAAARAVPPYHGELAEVRGRGRTRRRRRTGASAGLAALAAAAAIAVPMSLGDRDAPPPGLAADPSPGVTAGPEAPPAEPAQRLLTDGAGFVMARALEMVGAEGGESAEEAYERLLQLPGAVGVIGEYSEVLPDGRVVPLDLDLPGIDSVREVVAMPDGRLAAIGIVDLMPGVSREDGPCVEGVEFPLLVVEADGTVSASHDVWTRCRTLDLLDADGRTAYLMRGSRLVGLDLATGRERVLLDAPELIEVGGDIAIGGSRVAALPAQVEACLAGGSSGPLTLTVAELDTGRVTEHPTGAFACGMLPGRLRLSPDGRFAAFTYLGGDPSRYDLRVVVADLRTGEVVVERTVVGTGTDDDNLPITAHRYSLTSAEGAISGIAWDDARTLRIAWYEVPERGVHRLADVIQVETVRLD